MIFEIENHRIPSHYDLHIKNFNSDELKFLIEYQYKKQAHSVPVFCIIHATDSFRNLKAWLLRVAINRAKDGTVWVYYMNRKMEITDKFDSDGVCFVQLKNGSDILYLTVKYMDGYATSPDGFIQPDTWGSQ